MQLHRQQHQPKVTRWAMDAHAVASPSLKRGCRHQGGPAEPPASTATAGKAPGGASQASWRAADGTSSLHSTSQRKGKSFAAVTRGSAPKQPTHTSLAEVEQAMEVMASRQGHTQHPLAAIIVHDRHVLATSRKRTRWWEGGHLQRGDPWLPSARLRAARSRRA
eukprot:TRINITY_DN14180_c0_g1_i1.p1 TRINITY_DN14180_c0_g1~~TRINITY_DN14180_c0_g1_i1.p1  ORF type:complete len:164 (+),score=17.51 TRINITY_DN14180_c0_g1_i1:122-613(+)